MFLIDTSALVPLFVQEARTAQVRSFVTQADAALVVSDLARAEFASAIARRWRMREFSEGQAGRYFAIFDDWIIANAETASISDTDLQRANNWIRRLVLNLRAPDAIHLAICHRLQATILTFDTEMGQAARNLDIPRANISAA
jgi:uncharacterized protein